MRPMTTEHLDPHAETAHGDDHGHADAHGHGGHGSNEAPLGPIDVAAWGAGILGVVIGLVIVLCFVLATA